MGGCEWLKGAALRAILTALTEVDIAAASAGLSPVTLSMSLVKTIGCGPGIAQVLAASHLLGYTQLLVTLSGGTPTGWAPLADNGERVSLVSDKGLLRWACC
ncbi:hypothetical protein EDB81DRAFT_777196 [Dactylonectria macrodidyma]|uniref:Uncharacterized protein n=1 Tax=Dactylonectria macrodidyma TaxID=307937 RepID=A0A9P9FQ18_9HYPO|nr:hypothetical protein EDB81DRAFT_777196 [Dactylonectria macrodidyma]